MSAKHWAFTSYEDEEPRIFGRIQFMVYQRERCPRTQRLHWQGYLCLATKSTLLWLKRNVDGNAHWEKCKGTVEENIAYCTKEESRVPGTQPVVLGYIDYP